jgi:hypothetical protein
MAISRQQLVKELEPGLNALFGLEYNRYENQHAEIFATETSDRAFEEEVMLSGFAGAPVKAEGAGVVFDQANETSLEQSLIDIAGFVDERGLRIATTGRKMIIPKELQFTAERIMKSPMRTGTADNDINAVRSMGMVPEGYVINNFLTDTDSYFLLTDVPNGFKQFVRAPIKTAMEGDFDTGNVRFKARERYSFGFSDPRCVFGNGNLPT